MCVFISLSLLMCMHGLDVSVLCGCVSLCEFCVLCIVYINSEYVCVYSYMCMYVGVCTCDMGVSVHV